MRSGAPGAAVPINAVLPSIWENRASGYGNVTCAARGRFAIPTALTRTTILTPIPRKGDTPSLASLRPVSRVFRVFRTAGLVAAARQPQESFVRALLEPY